MSAVLGWHFIRNGDTRHAVTEWLGERQSALGSRLALFACGRQGPSYDPHWWQRQNREPVRCKACVAAVDRDSAGSTDRGDRGETAKPAGEK